MTARKTLVRVGVAIGVLGALAGLGVTALWIWVTSDLPDLRALDDYRPALTSRVYDRHGALIGEFYEERRQLTPMPEIPKLVVNAFLAAEDDTFYEHGGVDFVSMLRAAWVTLTTDETQGASTITQQLAKNLLLTSERTYTRKAKEALLARQIEQRFDKDAILWRYLNHIYFGSGAYGVAEAARTYFDKPLAELTPSEAALIAGLPKAPSKFSPHTNPTRADERRRYVLGRMRDVGFLDEAAYQANIDAKPLLKSPDPSASEAAAYVTEEVRRRLVAELDNEFVLRGGLRIDTTIDLALQQTAVRALQSGVEALDHRRGYRGALRKLKPDAIAAELPKLALENELEPNAPPAPRFFAKPRTGVVLAVEDKQQRARVAFGAGVEANVALASSNWAHAKKGGAHGGSIARLSQALAVGDVAQFKLEAPAADAQPGPLSASLYQVPDVQGALLSFDVKTGDLLALVGGYDFASSEFDRATQAKRQAGSAFKPIVYAAALANGFTPATIVYDRPAVYDDGSGTLWRPENYGREFLGRLTLTEALARSINNAAVYILSDVGIQPTLDLAHALGVKSKLDTGLSLALGTSSVTLLEITRAYGVFAAGGKLVEPRLIARVLDREGEVVIQNVPLDGPVAKPVDAKSAAEEAAAQSTQSAAASAQQPVVRESESEDASLEADGEALGEGDVGMVEEILEERPFPKLTTPKGYAIAPAHAFVVAQTLRAPVEHPNGTAGRARSLGPYLAGKTGTTNDQTDAWFVGFSPEVVTGVWVGIDERDVLGPKETGGKAALPIWMDYMKAALAGRKPAGPEAPDGVTFVRIDTKTGKLAGAGSRAVMTQAFLTGTEPLERAEAASAGASEEATERKRRLDF